LTVSKPELTTAGLQAILNAAIAKAEELKAPSIITVLDSSGVQQAFFRMGNAPMISYELSPSRHIPPWRSEHPPVTRPKASPPPTIQRWSRLCSVHLGSH